MLGWTNDAAVQNRAKKAKLFVIEARKQDGTRYPLKTIDILSSLSQLLSHCMRKVLGCLSSTSVTTKRKHFLVFFFVLYNFLIPINPISRHLHVHGSLQSLDRNGGMEWWTGTVELPSQQNYSQGSTSHNCRAPSLRFSFASVRMYRSRFGTHSCTIVVSSWPRRIVQARK